MIERECDVAIVGSGAGGGTVAAELAPLCEQGLSVAVFEWGPKLPDAAYTGKPLEMAARLYFEDGGVATRQGTMTLAFARAYGGSTVVYTGTSLVIRRPDLERWKVPGLEWDDVRRRSLKHLERNGARLLAPGELNENNRLFREACRRLGYHAFQFPVNVRGCRGSGLCNLGCPSGAKQGTHRVQLPAAERGGVSVITNARVERIGERFLDVEVSPPAVRERAAWAPGRYRVRAKTVVAAAGAVNSPALLLRSGFGGRLPALGRYFTAHPAVIVAGLHRREIGASGHPKSFCCDHFQDSHDFLLETCMYFPAVAAKSLAGFGPEHRRMLERPERLQMILALALDPARPENRVRIDRRGDPVVEYRLGRDVLRSLRAASETSARILFESGAERVHAPVGPPFGVDRADWLRRGKRLSGSLWPGVAPIASAHLMGGCRMGTDADDSVTDAWGRVHGIPWLFVADASLFPGAARTNPYPTIMALADRVAEAVREEARELAA